MKKLLKTVLVVLLCITSAFSFNSFAAEGEKVQWYDIDITDGEMQEILDLNPQNNASTRASDLILTYNAGINREGSTLYLVAKMVCDVDVVKCGFKKIVIQRRATASSSWSNYVTYEDLYNDNSAHLISRAISITSGYQYQAVCTFYAKKNILVTQKIVLDSNIVTY